MPLSGQSSSSVHDGICRWQSETRDALVAALGELGLTHCSAVQVGRKSCGNLIASKHRLEPLAQLPERNPFPELLVGVNVKLDVGHLAVLSIHAPNGSGNGWDKIHVLRALSRAVQQLAGERVVIGGDFNEPRYFPGIVPVRSFAWTDEETWEQRQHEGWTRTNARGESETASRASRDETVRWFFEPRSGLRRAYWEHRNTGSMEPTHWSRGALPERWFDHVLRVGASSRAVEPIRSRAEPALRRRERPQRLPRAARACGLTTAPLSLTKPKVTLTAWSTMARAITPPALPISSVISRALQSGDPAATV